MEGVSLRRAASGEAVLAVAAFGAFLAFVDTTIVNVAFPDIRRSFTGTSISELSWVFNAYNIVFAAFLVAAGRLTDLLGRRRMFSGGVLLFTAASALCAAAGSAEELIAFRALQAAGAAILVPASLALVIEAFPAGRRSHAVSLWGAAGALAAGVGPPLGGAIVQASSWRLAFLINIPLGVAALVLARRTLVESRSPGRRTLPDVQSAALLAGGIALLTLGIVQGGEWGWASGPVLGSFAGAVALVAAFVRRTGRHPSPVLDPALLRVRAFAMSNVLTVVVGMGFYAYLLNHILFLTTVWGYDILSAGLAVAPGALVATVVAALVGRLADRVEPRWIVLPGALIWAASFVWYVDIVGPLPDFLGQWLPGQILSGIGVGLTLPVLGSAAVASVPGARYATASAVVSSARQLGAVLGIALLVVILGTPTAATAQDAFDRGWTFSAICFLVAALGAPLIGRIAREEVPADTVRQAGGHVALTGDGPPGPALDRRIATHEQHSSAEAFLAGVPMFGALPDDARARLAGAARLTRLEAGAVLFRQGDPSDSLYILRSGRLDVLHDQQIVNVLGRGAVLGELGLLTGVARSATIRAGRDCELLTIRGATFDALLEAEPGMALAISRQLAAQLQTMPAAARRVRQAPSVVAMVAMEAGLSLPEMAADLAAEFGDAGVLWPQALPDEASQALERAEREHRRVVLVAPTPDPADPWTAFCLRQADRVLALSGGSPPPWVATTPALRGAEVLVGGERITAADLDAWLAVAEPRRLVRVKTRGDLRLVARRLAGRATGLVLSGGGARALAHLGVLEELGHAGVVVDRVGGSSMGAFIGALYAMGLSPDEIDATCYEEFVRRNPVGDYTVPRVSLVRGRRGHLMLQRCFGDRRIEELQLDFFCVSADLVSRRVVVHRSGSVVAALEASMCLPGIFPPIVDGPRVLVDGGVLDNLPVGPMAQGGEGPVIAVDVTQQFEQPDSRDVIAPGVNGGPGIGEILARSLMMASIDTVLEAQRHATMVVVPANADVGVLEFHQIDRMRESGREAMRQALRAPEPATV